MTFNPIGVEDYDRLKGFFENQPYNLSVYSLLSIIVWSGQEFSTGYAIHEGKAIFSNVSNTDPSDRYLILPVPCTEDQTPASLHRLASELGFRCYWFVPGDYLDTFDPEVVEAHFTVTDQGQYEDYIYLTRDLVRLKGNKFAKKRNLLHQFSRQYLEQDRVTIEGMTAQNISECLVFLEKWCAQHDDCEGEVQDDLACEKKALITALRHVEALEGRGILIRIDGVVSALGISSRLNNQMGVLNFEKAFADIRGLYQFLDQECARHLFAGFKYINKESDMGLADLAQSKKSYNPIMRVKSYRLDLR